MQKTEKHKTQTSFLWRCCKRLRDKFIEETKFSDPWTRNSRGKYSSCIPEKLRDDELSMDACENYCPRFKNRSTIKNMNCWNSLQTFRQRRNHLFLSCYKKLGDEYSEIIINLQIISLHQSQTQCKWHRWTVFQKSNPILWFLCI